MSSALEQANLGASASLLVLMSLDELAITTWRSGPTRYGAVPA